MNADDAEKKARAYIKKFTPVIRSLDRWMVPKINNAMEGMDNEGRRALLTIVAARLVYHATTMVYSAESADLEEVRDTIAQMVNKELVALTNHHRSKGGK